MRIKRKEIVGGIQQMGVPLTIKRYDSTKHSYEVVERLYFDSWSHFTTLKHQYFQLFSDQLPIIAIMLSRDCKV